MANYFLRAVDSRLGLGLDGQQPDSDSGLGLEPKTLSNPQPCSADMERSFSVYKSIFTDHRTNFTDEDLKKVVISHCFCRRNWTLTKEKMSIFFPFLSIFWGFKINYFSIILFKKINWKSGLYLLAIPLLTLTPQNFI